MAGKEIEPTGINPEKEQSTWTWQAPESPEEPIRPFETQTPEEQQRHRDSIKTPETPPSAVQNQIDILTIAKNAGLD